MIDFQNVIASGVNEFIASVTRNLKPNEAAAVGQIVRGVVALMEAEAVNRGAPALVAALAGKYPVLAAAIEQVPELKAIL